MKIQKIIRQVSSTISTDKSYSGTPSNKFDFTNTSRAKQTVHYGYTKI